MLAIPLTSTAPSPTTCACNAWATERSDRFIAPLYTFGQGKKSCPGSRMLTWRRKSSGQLSRC
jgi:hypothetical protein